MDIGNITESNKLQYYISESSSLRGSGNNRNIKTISRHLAQKAILCTAAEQMQNIKYPACIKLDLVNRIFIFKRKAFINTANKLAVCTRSSLTCFFAIISNFIGHISGLSKKVIIRVDKELKRLRVSCKLLHIVIGIILAVRSEIAANFLNKPKTAYIFEIIDFAVCTKLV